MVVPPSDLDPLENDCGPVSMPAARITRKQIQAQQLKANRSQNIGRATYTATGLSTTWEPGVRRVVPFDTHSTMDVTARMWRSEQNPITNTPGMAFVCQEAGYYNIKSAIEVRISLPAVVDTKITYVVSELLYQPADGGLSTTFWQAAEYGQVRVVPGTPETVDPIYLRGWCLSHADKLKLNCGDKLWLQWYFNGEGQIGFAELYRARLAIQRTGDPFIDLEECC